jgi:hypothetical protein
LSTQTGNTYQWFKDGVAISCKSQQYQTSTAGQYSVKVDFGSCSSTPITLEVPFTSSLNVSATTIINEGETKTVIATTNAVPVFEWYRNSTIIAGATTNTLMLRKKAIIVCKTNIRLCTPLKSNFRL